MSAIVLGGGRGGAGERAIQTCNFPTTLIIDVSPLLEQFRVFCAHLVWR